MALLARGMVTPAEAARLGKVSRQLVRHWLKAAGIDWRKAWQARQAAIWHQEIAKLNGQRLRAATKREQRRNLAKRMIDWDEANTKHLPPGRKVH